MAVPGKVGNRPGEFGGLPGEFGNTDAGEPLSPELEQRALYRAEGGTAVRTDELGQTPSDLKEPSHGTGGVRQKSQSFS